MKFILVSRHTGGRQAPESESEQLVKDMGIWLSMMKNPTALPIRGGKSVTLKKVDEYVGEVGGVIIFEADNFDQALSLAQKSPGLKYGWTHDVFPEISLDAASKQGS